ncbi:hypothetical protein BKA62DRAFT_719178 [Auriculariales sp. MPI-PUGE-AT-0066]|nr:hypothetical protein BKA62DRAFT_719178 [Auriculariales sp. MPI-PUGE-AT-0066]
MRPQDFSMAQSNDDLTGFPRPEAGEWEMHEGTTVPYYKFPPWPEMPHGRTIMPFDVFRASGIPVPTASISSNPLRATITARVEVDALGIPTVQLEVVHGTGKKGKKKKGRAGALAAGGNISEAWDAADRAAWGGQPVDLTEDRGSRLEQALSQFQSIMTWTPELQSVSDFWKVFLGLVKNPNQLQTHRKTSAKNLVPAADEVDADDFDDDVPMAVDGAAGDREPESTTGIPSTTASTSEPPAGDAEDNAMEVDRLHNLDAMAEAKLDRFLNNPARAVQVFLSAWIMQNGMYWMSSRQKLAPRFVTSFVTFLIKTNAIAPGPNSQSTAADIRKSLEHALEIAKQASIELPLGRDLSQVLSPEKFGRSCMTEWGEATSTGVVVVTAPDGWPVDTDMPTAASVRTPAPVRSPTPDAGEIDVEVINSDATCVDHEQFAHAIKELDPNAIALDHDGIQQQGELSATSSTHTVPPLEPSPAPDTATSTTAAPYEVNRAPGDPDATAGATLTSTPAPPSKTGWETSATGGASTGAAPGWGSNPDAFGSTWAQDDPSSATADWSAGTDAANPIPAASTFADWTGLDSSKWAPVRAETSVRAIVRIIPPNSGMQPIPGTDGHPGRKLVGLVLGAWEGPFGDIEEPEVVWEGTTPANANANTNASTTDGVAPDGYRYGVDEIIVYVQPEALPALQRAVAARGSGSSGKSMGASGIWIQVAQKENDVAPDISATAAIDAPVVDTSKPKKKKKSPPKGGARGFWYAERVSGFFVSYWENDEIEVRAEGEVATGDDGDV